MILRVFKTDLHAFEVVISSFVVEDELLDWGSSILFWRGLPYSKRGFKGGVESKRCRIEYAHKAGVVELLHLANPFSDRHSIGYLVLSMLVETLGRDQVIMGALGVLVSSTRHTLIALATWLLA